MGVCRHWFILATVQAVRKFVLSLCTGEICASLSLSLSVFLCPRWTLFGFSEACVGETSLRGKRLCDSVLSAIKEILGWEGPLCEQRSGGWNCRRDLGILSENNWVFMRALFLLLLGARTDDWITLSRTLISTFSPKMHEKLSAGMEGDSSPFSASLSFSPIPWIHFSGWSSSGGGGSGGSMAGPHSASWRWNRALEPRSWIFSGCLCDSCGPMSSSAGAGDGVLPHGQMELLLLLGPELCHIPTFGRYYYWYFSSLLTSLFQSSVINGCFITAH